MTSGVAHKSKNEESIQTGLSDPINTGHCWPPEDDESPRMLHEEVEMADALQARNYWHDEVELTEKYSA